MANARSFISWLLALLALVPLGLIALAGFYSRMKIDDFCVVASAQHFDAWGTMLYHLNAWSGSYTRFFLIGLLGPLDHVATAITPSIIVTLWFCSLSWLLYEALISLGVKTSRWATAIALVRVNRIRYGLRVSIGTSHLLVCCQYSLRLALRAFKRVSCALHSRRAPRGGFTKDLAGRRDHLFPQRWAG